MHRPVALAMLVLAMLGATSCLHSEAVVCNDVVCRTYDADRAVIVLVGGQRTGRTFDDVWEFTQATNADRHTPRFSPTPRVTELVHDAERDLVVLFGGYAADGIRDDTWLFDGTSWQLAAVATRPPPRFFHQPAYDAERKRVIVEECANGIDDDGDRHVDDADPDCVD